MEDLVYLKIVLDNEYQIFCCHPKTSELASARYAAFLEVSRNGITREQVGEHFDYVRELTRVLQER